MTPLESGRQSKMETEPGVEYFHRANLISRVRFLRESASPEKNWLVICEFCNQRIERWHTGGYMSIVNHWSSDPDHRHELLMEKLGN